MPRRTKKTSDDASDGIISIHVDASHVATPHSIELSFKDGRVDRAKVVDLSDRQMLGARTIESLIRENGVDLPVNKEELAITFSPHNGEVVAIVAVDKTPAEAPAPAADDPTPPEDPIEPDKTPDETDPDAE